MSTQHDTKHDHHASASAAYVQRRLTPAENKTREIRTKTIESLLSEKGLVSAERLDAVINAYAQDIGPLNGARVVARAWVDPAYKERLLKNGTVAVAELGFGGLQGEHLVVVENTPSTHNVVVCALCSCYPWPVLGLPPFWYKSTAYRTRVTGNPRTVLHEFGLTLDDSTEILVWNSSAAIRYMVLPERPGGTEHLAEDALASLVTRDAMIGVARVQPVRREEPTSAHRRVADMEGQAALPRQSGELVFQDPWEGIAFAMAVALCEGGLYPWSEFQDRLITATAAADQQDVEARPTYYECWLAAFEAVMVGTGVLTKEQIDTKAAWVARSVSSSRARAFPWLLRDMPDDED
jgi:nitrile hydratase